MADIAVLVDPLKTPKIVIHWATTAKMAGDHSLRMNNGLTGGMAVGARR